jgi:multisubunit Na+/H+ antiporter MnhB subunit
MSHEYYRRGRNWYTAIGALFLIMAGIVIVRQLLIWGPEFMSDFLLNSEVTNEKVSAGMIGFGIFMIVLGFRKYEQPR